MTLRLVLDFERNVMRAVILFYSAGIGRTGTIIVINMLMNLYTLKGLF